jgi:hypothetical protein
MNMLIGIAARQLHITVPSSRVTASIVQLTLQSCSVLSAGTAAKPAMMQHTSFRWDYHMEISPHLVTGRSPLMKVSYMPHHFLHMTAGNARLVPC